MTTAKLCGAKMATTLPGSTLEEDYKAFCNRPQKLTDTSDETNPSNECPGTGKVMNTDTETFGNSD
jgi:hypothetical protein